MKTFACVNNYSHISFIYYVNLLILFTFSYISVLNIKNNETCIEIINILFKLHAQRSEHISSYISLFSKPAHHTFLHFH